MSGPFLKPFQKEITYKWDSWLEYWSRKKQRFYYTSRNYLDPSTKEYVTQFNLPAGFPAPLPAHRTEQVQYPEHPRVCAGAGAGAGAGAASGERVGNVDPRLKFPDGGAAASAGAASGADAGAERHDRSRPSTPSLTWGKNEVATFDKTEAPRGGILKSTKSSYSRGSGGGARGSAKGGRGGSSGGSIGVDSRQRGVSDSDEIARLKAELAAKAREVEAEKQKVARVQQSAQRYAAAVRISV